MIHTKNRASAQSLAVKYLPIELLKPYPKNARKHSNHQILQIAGSMRAFGFTNPLLINRDNIILAGHARFEAAKLSGMDSVPTICLEDLTEDQVRAYILADNKLAENATWDRSILAIELQQLMTLDSAEFDVTITGFEVPEIDVILEEAREASQSEDAIPELNSDQPAVTELGDVWLLGKNRIICGNALHDETYRILMCKGRASVVFTDPPYNVKIVGHATGNGAIQHREFAMASGEFTGAEFIAFLSDSQRLLVRYSANNSVHFICMDWRHVTDLVAVGKQNYDELLNICVWVKDNGGMGSFYRSQHELVLVFRKGKGPHRNNVQLGQFGRYRTNVWQYPGVSTQSKQGDEGNLLALHPTVKPIAMVADAILDCSARGEIVLDAFLGSGTTLMAAERVGRLCCGIEIDPAYVDVAIRRWQNYTGEAAVHAVTGKRFNELVVSKEATLVG